MQSIPFSRRIGTKIIAIFLIALLPMVAVIAYLNLHMRRDALEQGRNMGFRAAFEAAAAQERMVSDLRHLLRRLAEEPASRDLDAAALDRELVQLRQGHAALSNVFVSDAQGHVIASAQKPFSGLSVATRHYFTESLRKNGFAAGEFLVGRVTGNPVIHFALPIRREDGATTGVAVASINLHSFPNSFKKLEAQQGVFLAILDAQGTLLARMPATGHLKPGDRLTDFFQGRFSWGQAYGSFVARGPNGIETLYAYQALRLSPEDQAPYGAILAGMPVSVATEAARRWLYVSIVVSVGSLLAALLLVVGLSRVTIVRRLEILAGFAASLREDKVCRLPPRFGLDEIGVLGWQLADMSRALHDKNDRLAEAMTTLEQERDRLSVVVGQLSDAREELERLASVDFLTGLHNRRCFSDKMRLELTRLERYGTPFSLILFDIDDFKRINDTYGHNVGDDVLQALGRLTTATVRATDEAYRIGGEEFAVVLPQTRGEEAMVLAERLREGTARLAVPLPDGDAVGLTISLGVIEAWAGAHVDRDIFAAADNALYAAKGAGKNVSRLAQGHDAT